MMSQNPPSPEEKEKKLREEELQRIATMRDRLSAEDRERQKKHAAEKERRKQQEQKMAALSREESIRGQREQREWWEKRQEKKKEERETIKKMEKRKQEEQQKQQKEEQRKKQQKEDMRKIHDVVQEQNVLQRKKMAEHFVEGEERKTREHTKAYIALVEQTHRDTVNRLKEEALRHRAEIEKGGTRRLRLIEASAHEHLQKEEKKCADIERDCRKLPLSLARQTIGRARAELEHVRQKEKGTVDRERKILEEGMRRSIATMEKELSMRLQRLEEEKKRAITAATDQEQGKITELEGRKASAFRQADTQSKI